VTSHNDDDAGPVAGDAYADVPYASPPHPSTDPNQLAVVARMHGLDAPDPTTARVLDLGCGDGANLMAIAAAWPATRCVGVDLSAAAITRGRELARRAGLTNVELHVGNLLEAQPLGEFDYVLLHGMLSWVPAPVRAAALRLAAGSLAPGGLVMCDYNALPGWHRWSASRDLLLLGASRTDVPAERAAHARAALQLAVDLHGGSGTHAQILGESLYRANSRADDFLYHDDMNPECTPFRVGDVAALAREGGLAYVGEARPGQWWEVLEEPAVVLRGFLDGDPVRTQALADLVQGVEFKATVFARADAAWLRTSLQRERAHDLVVHWDADREGTPGDGDNPLWRALIDAVEAAGPRGASISDVANTVGESLGDVADAALQLANYRVFALRVAHPPATTAPGERPLAHQLARAQAAGESFVSTLAHGHVMLDDPLTRALIPLLDGTRDRDALVRELAAHDSQASGPSTGTLHAAIEGVLDRLAAAGLFRAAG
jgi:SAM-dependent methyltransferase